MIWIIASGVAGFLVGWLVACCLTAANLNDLLSANEYLQQEVKRWRNEFETLKEQVIKHVR